MFHFRNKKRRRDLHKGFVGGLLLEGESHHEEMAEVEKRSKAKKAKKPYKSPTLTQVTPEQTKLKLLGHAMAGDQDAKDILEIVEVAEEHKRKKKPA